jgi:hypothetical protein
LRDLVAGGKARPSFFDSRENGWTKVVLHP